MMSACVSKKSPFMVRISCLPDAEVNVAVALLPNTEKTSTRQPTTHHKPHSFPTLISLSIPPHFPFYPPSFQSELTFKTTLNLHNLPARRIFHRIRRMDMKMLLHNTAQMVPLHV
jgi:hypothetical protein